MPGRASPRPLANAFGRMWRFYLLSCAGAFRARSLQVYGILFSKQSTAADAQPLRVRSLPELEPDESMAPR